MATPTPNPDAIPEPDGNAAMLAELDALLERMMALPVSPSDDIDALPVRRTETPPDDMAIITVTEAGAQAPPPERGTPTVPTVSTATDDLYFKALLAEQHPEPIRPPEPVAVHSTPPDLATPPLPSPAPEELAPPAPLAWPNRLFDRAMQPLGKPGRWLSGPAGRNWLGWSGVLMLVVVAGLAVSDYLAWTR